MRIISLRRASVIACALCLHCAAHPTLGRAASFAAPPAPDLRDTHVIRADVNGSDAAGTGAADAPVATIARALQIASALQPSEQLPVLIRLGQGEFIAPSASWQVDLAHIHFAGNGIDNTFIVADRVQIMSNAISSFRDLTLQAALNIGDEFLPVHQVKIMALQKGRGDVLGAWCDAAGQSRGSLPDAVPAGLESALAALQASVSNSRAPRLLAAPDRDASNTFVLKHGDTMQGSLIVTGEVRVIGTGNRFVSTDTSGGLGAFGFSGFAWQQAGECYYIMPPFGGVTNFGAYTGLGPNYVAAPFVVGSPSSNNHAATKAYVDLRAIAVSNALSSNLLALAVYVDGKDSVATGLLASHFLFLTSSVARLDAQDVGITNWTAAYVLGVLTNGQTMVYITSNQLSVVSNTFYFAGNLFLQNNQIFGLAWPQSNDSAATKGYVDFRDAAISNALSSNLLALAVYLDGKDAAITGLLSSCVVLLTSSVSRLDRELSVATNRMLAYVNAATNAVVAGQDARFVKKAGDSMAGSLGMAGNDISNVHTVTFRGDTPLYSGTIGAYYDGVFVFNGMQVPGVHRYLRIGSGPHAGTTFPISRSEFVSWLPGYWYELVGLPADPFALDGCAARIYECEPGSAGMLDMNRNSIANVGLLATPTQECSLTFVHVISAPGPGILCSYYTPPAHRVPRLIRFVSGALTGRKFAITNYYSMGETVCAYAGLWGQAQAGDDAELLELACVTVQSNGVNMGGYALENLRSPQAEHEAATKLYVDTRQFQTTNIANGTVTTDKIANGGVTAAKLAADVDSRYVRKSGDTINGPLRVQGIMLAGDSIQSSNGQLLAVYSGSDTSLLGTGGLLRIHAGYGYGWGGSVDIHSGDGGLCAGNVSIYCGTGSNAMPGSGRVFIRHLAVPQYPDSPASKAYVDGRLVAGSNIADSAVSSATIADRTIMNVDIADNAAIADTKLATISAPGKVADSALGANISKLGQAIESSEIANGTITSADIADNAISAAQLATGAVTGDKLAPGAVTAGVLDPMGATVAGQVLKWSGSAWHAGVDEVGTGMVNSVATTNGVYLDQVQMLQTNGVLQFNVMQCNRITLTANTDFVEIMYDRIRPSSLILVTPESPHSEGFYQYWVVPTNGLFRVHIMPRSEWLWTFNFFIVRF